MNKRILAIVVLIVLVAVGLGIWKNRADAAARRSAAQERLNTITKQQDLIDGLWTPYNSLVTAYGAKDKDARDASQKRHDSNDRAEGLVLAKKELADVVFMQTTISRERDALDKVADGYAAALGDGAVSGLRSTASQLTQTKDLGLNRWWRAITDIVDAVSGNSYPTENIEQMYDESNDYDTKAETLIDQLKQKWTELDKQVQGKVDSAKRDLAVIR